MADSDYDPYDEVHIAAPGEQRSKSSLFLTWLSINFQRRRLSYLVAMAATILIGLWAENWIIAPFLFLVPALVVAKIMNSITEKQGSIIVIESRMQGQVITHCPLYQKPIVVPNSGVVIWQIPKRMMRPNYHFAYGDNKPPVRTQLIEFVDYVDWDPENPNRPLVLIYPEDTNFGNFNFYARIGGDLEREMKRLGLERMNNENIKQTMISLYKKGEVEQWQVEAFLNNLDEAEQVMANSDVAKRRIWNLHRESVPRMQEEMISMANDIPRLAMAKSAQFAHRLARHPMNSEVMDRIIEMSQPIHAVDWEKHRREQIRKEMKTEGDDYLKHAEVETLVSHTDPRYNG